MTSYINMNFNTFCGVWPHSWLPPPLSSAARRVSKLRLNRGNDNHSAVAWLEWYLSCLMPCLFSSVLSQWCSRPSVSVLSAVIGVFLSVRVCAETLPPLSWAGPFFCVCLSLSFIQSLTFPHSLFSLPFLLPLFMSACFLLLLLLSSPALLPQGLRAFLPGGAEVSVIWAR